ncbi:MAG TPA: efflux RND transporter periplasmic adaptor subunit [Candidatus Limnocylindrales bacterium]|nr:efflux RND transporter periplasmic adaptor subunit [Candidatus Limnocylindrales bacterium]
MKGKLIGLAITFAILGAIAWGAMRFVRVTAAPGASAAEVPTTSVKQGKVIISVAARGELQGGNSEMLSAPMTGNDQLAITSLRDPGELVEPGDVVVQFDTTTQEYNLREAEADLAEADQQVIQAQANADASVEETAYAVKAAESAVTLAKLDVRRNPLLPSIQARQNDIALEQAQNRLKQAQQDVANKSANAQAGTAIQQANLNKAKVTAETAKRNIESMTLKAKTAGYVNIQNNTFTNIIYTGMQLQPFQLGDTVRPGLTVAQIPDMKQWEVSAQIGELDRGHLNAGQKVAISVVALPGKTFDGHVKSMGGTAGSPWDRHFEARISLDKPAPELRPGETSNMLITVETLDNVLWVPSQALFDTDGRKFVYVKTPKGFMPRDVTLVRSSESQAVITGLKDGDEVAMSNPDQQNKPATQNGGAMKALQK